MNARLFFNHSLAPRTQKRRIIPKSGTTGAAGQSTTIETSSGAPDLMQTAPDACSHAHI
jgi:hypothetical protein